MFIANNKQKQWKQINFRTVNTVIGAEFLHELYNRYHPSINMIRFKNTVITYKSKKATSYAPAHEWDFLEEWFGEKFIRGMDDIYGSLEEALLDFKKPAVKRLLEKFEKTDFKSLDNIELALALIDLQTVTVGEIYRVNLVQIEHALSYAINYHLKEFFNDENERRIAFTYLILSTGQTEATKEENEFFELVKRGLKLGADLNNKESKQYKEIFSLIQNHHKEYSYLHSAYGATPYDINYYIKQYILLFEKGEKGLQDLVSDKAENIKNINELKKEYKETIKGNPILTKNVDYMTRIGELRDRNKAMMGRTNVWRDIILGEVVERTNTSLEDLSVYFISDICNLLKRGVVLNADEISKRKEGLVFYRNEFVSNDYEEVLKEIKGSVDNSKLKGVCASAGFAEGEVKIIKSSEDIGKMKQGDIMVSPGTDFDLINAMQKAGAIITEEGGLLSHASVVSRELGIPCVIGVVNATSILKEGSKVKVDADGAVIYIL